MGAVTKPVTKAVSNIFGGGSSSSDASAAPAAPASKPASAPAALQQAATAARDVFGAALTRRRGRAANILAGESDGGTTAQKKLLGE